MDVWLPDWLRQARSSFRYLGNTAVSRGQFSGVARSASLGGARFACKIDFTPHGGRSTDGALERRALRALTASIDGQANRILAADASYQIGGSFPASELMPNNTFPSGTTGYQSFNSDSAISVADRALRSQLAKGAGENFVSNSSAITVVQYAPYALRAMVMPGRSVAGTKNYQALIGSSVGSPAYANSGSIPVESGKLLTVAGVVRATTAFAGVGEVPANGSMAGDCFFLPYISLARCALVDNASNLLQQSDNITVAPWTNVRSTDAANAATAPDGSSTADSLIEDSTASNTHYIEQSATVAAAAASYAFAIALAPDSLTWANIAIGESTGGTECSAYVNLATGAVGTTAAGANWSNVRVFPVSLGNGWWYFCIVARKTNAATTLTARIYTAADDGVASYSGDGTSRISVWGATLAASAVPVRLSHTTSAATTGTSQTGYALHLKGLPASTNGLLLPGDWFEVITPTYSSLHMMTAALNSDAAELGYAQFVPALRQSPADGAAVIVHQPHGRFLLTQDLAEYLNDPGVWTTASFELEEAGF